MPAQPGKPPPRAGVLTMGPGGPGGPRSPGEPWGETAGLDVIMARGAPTSHGLHGHREGLGWRGVAGGAGQRQGRERTHLLASLARDAWGAWQPGITHAVRVRAVTLWGVGTRQELGTALPTGEPCQASPSPAKCPQKRPPLPKALDACAKRGRCRVLPQRGPSLQHPGDRGARPGWQLSPRGQGEGAGRHSSLTRASSALGNWAKHWKRTQESPGDPQQDAPGEPRGTEPRILHPSGAQHPLLHPAPAPAQDKPVALPGDPIPAGGSCAWQPACTPGSTSMPGACPERARSVPGACPALQAPAALRNPMPRGLGASLPFIPRPTRIRVFRAPGFPPGGGQYSHGRSSRCRGHPACPRPPSLP